MTILCSHCGKPFIGMASVAGHCGFSPQQSAIMDLLIARAPRPVPITDIVAHLWPRPDDEPASPEILIRTQIQRMRKKMHAAPYTISARRGVSWGYSIILREALAA